MSTDQMTAPSTTTPPSQEASGGSGFARTARRAAVILAAVLIVGNLALILTHLLSWAFGPGEDVDIEGIPRVRAVTDELWRGRAPDDDGYRALAARGVTTIVDLRAEEYLVPPLDLFDELGLEFAHIPIRDGQTPTPEQVRTFLDLMEDNDGTVYLHCGAGVGRTGVMTAAYREATEDPSNISLLYRNFSIGPPSLEQIWYAATIDDDGPPQQPPAVIKGVSRFFDGPRRLFHAIRAGSLL